MNKLKVLIPVLVIIMLLLAAVTGYADEAEDLTPGLDIKTVDNGGRVKRITDGQYTTYWESGKRENPYVILSSDKPVYSLYICFRTMPESYVIQKETADGWETVAEGDTRFYHAFYEINGMTKIRILSTAQKKNKLAISELFCFGKGEVPGWVQRWEPTAEKADIMFIVAHPDDELIFLGGAIPYYALELNRSTVVAYMTPANYPARRSEALNGLWTMGIRSYPVFGPFSDHYAKTGKLQDAYKELTGGKQAIWEWVTELFRKYQPEVVVTHDLDGEYGHPQHKMIADSATVCYDQAADPDKYPASAAEYGTWQVKKLYLHLYGDEETQTVFDWTQPLASFGGKTGNELAEEAFRMHESQYGKSAKIRGKRIKFTVEEFGVKRYPNNRYGLYRTEVGPDENRDDFLEHIKVSEVFPATEAEPETVTEDISSEEETADPEPDEEELPDEEETADIEETADEEEPADAAEAAETEETEVESAETDEEESIAEELTEEPEVQTAVGVRFRNVAAPEWADVSLNDNGFLDEGEFILEDADNRHWMFVNQTLRIQITRSLEEPPKQTKKEAAQHFYCYTAEIWCDTDQGEIPFTTWSEPDKPREKMKPKVTKTIAEEQPMVFCTSTDYYTYRLGRSKSGVYEGVVIRDGEILYDVPAPIKKRYNFPTYETLALYRDGRVESWHSKEKSAEEYIRDGACQVYTFGPCIVRDGACTEFITEIANRVLNPRHAFGMVEPGHYIDVICEGRLKSTNGSTGVTMGDLAQIMIDRGCSIAVNLDGGQTAVMAFMGKQLNMVQKSDPNGRPTKEVLCFGKRDR